MALSLIKRAAAREDMEVRCALPRYLSVYELAALLNCHEISVYKWARLTPERLPLVTRIGGRLLFDSRDVEAWFDQQRGETVVFRTAPDLQPLPGESRAGSATGDELPKRRRGRPTKVEQLERRQSAQHAVTHQ